MNNVKIKIFNTNLGICREVDEEVNAFCEHVNVIDVKLSDTKVMVIYTEYPAEYTTYRNE